MRIAPMLWACYHALSVYSGASSTREIGRTHYGERNIAHLRWLRARGVQ
jgi:hypothetical protein